MKERDEQQQHGQADDPAAVRPASDDPRATAAPQEGQAIPEQAGPAGGGEPPVGSAQAETGEGLQPGEAEELVKLLEDARARADQTHDQLLRVRAEMENMKRRQAKELENAHKFALEAFVKELLLVRDSLELGYAAAVEPEADVARLREGTELTLKQLSDVMQKFGVERVHPGGEPFNPELHQAMSIQPRPDLPPNTVTAVIQSGYLLNGRLVRPALVMVSKQD